MTPSRSPRIDATRNRESLLNAAESEFEEKGLSASIADIARRAGVAKATVFRHFSTKEELIVAIVSEHVSYLSEAAELAATKEDAEEALFGFLKVAAEHRRQHDLTVLQSVSETDANVIRSHHNLLRSLDFLVERARRQGVLRRDVTTADVFLMMCAPVHIASNLPSPEPRLWERYLVLLFDGLRPQGATPLLHPAPVLNT